MAWQPLDTAQILIKHSLGEGKFPTRRRRGKWRARWEFDRAVEALGASDIVIDCGANVGQFTRAMAASGATVYAFEPDPWTFGRLSESIGTRDNVRLINTAVSTLNGEAMLYRARGFKSDPDGLSESSSLYTSKTNIDEKSGVRVGCIDLAAFILSLPDRVALLKMDIEGAEVPVLLHLIATGAINRVGHAFVEMHENRIPELEVDARHLRALVRGHPCINLNWA